MPEPVSDTEKRTAPWSAAAATVMLAPGFGTPTLAYTIDTVETNLPEATYKSADDVIAAVKP